MRSTIVRSTWKGTKGVGEDLEEYDVHTVNIISQMQ